MRERFSLAASRSQRSDGERVGVRCFVTPFNKRMEVSLTIEFQSGIADAAQTPQTVQRPLAR